LAASAQSTFFGERSDYIIILFRRLQFPVEILTNGKLDAARTGNWFLENNLVIARLDKLSRSEDVQHKLQVTDCHWDLVVSCPLFGVQITSLVSIWCRFLESTRQT